MKTQEQLVEGLIAATKDFLTEMHDKDDNNPEGQSYMPWYILSRIEGLLDSQGIDLYQIRQGKLVAFNPDGE